jgi:hypothetical protein
MTDRSFLLLAISLAASGLLFIAFKLWPENRQLRLSKAFRGGLLVVLAAFSLGYNLFPYVKWILSPRHDIRNISRDLGRLEERMVLAGLVTPLIVMENSHEAHPYRADYINKDKNFIEKYGITHAFLSTSFQGVEKKQYLRDFPGVLEKAKLLARYPFWTNHLELYALDALPGKEGPPVRSREGEIFFSQGGIPRYDASASGRMAFLAEKNGKKALLQIEGPALFKGQHEFRFIMKTFEPKMTREKIAKLEVLDTSRRRILASKEIYLSDFTRSGKYQEFIVPVEVVYSSQTAFKITAFGWCDLWIDKVSW